MNQDVDVLVGYLSIPEQYINLPIIEVDAPIVEEK